MSERIGCCCDYDPPGLRCAPCRAHRHEQCVEPLVRESCCCATFGHAYTEHPTDLSPYCCFTVCPACEAKTGEDICTGDARYQATFGGDCKTALCVQHAAVVRRWAECEAMTDHPLAAVAGVS